MIHQFCVIVDNSNPPAGLAADTESMHFGRLLSKLREDRGLTQTGLADLVSTSLTTIQRGESENAQRCPWRRTMAVKVLAELERKLPLSEADASNYLQLAGLEAMARSAAESMRALRTETTEAKRAMASADVAARIDDPDIVTAIQWIERLFEERGGVAVLSALEGLSVAWSIDLPPRVRRDELTSSRNAYFYGGRIEPEPPRRLNVVSPPVQKPGYVEQVITEYEAPSHAPPAKPRTKLTPKRKAQ